MYLTIQKEHMITFDMWGRENF